MFIQTLMDKLIKRKKGFPCPKEDGPETSSPIGGIDAWRNVRGPARKIRDRSKTDRRRKCRSHLKIIGGEGNLHRDDSFK
jgi:hypothetical protein